MRSRLPILLAILGLVAAGVVAWRGGTGNPGRNNGAPLLSEEEAGTVAEGSGMTHSFPREAPDQFPDLLEGEGQEIAREELLPLFTARVGETVSLTAGEGLTGTVTMVHRHESGDLAAGMALAGLESATAFFTLSPDGRIGGHIQSELSGTAYRLEATERDEAYFLRKIRADELVCGRYEKGRLVPGMPPEPEASEPGNEAEAQEEAAAPLLESLPGSPRVVYLNFEGETVSGTPWNSSYNEGAPIVAAPFANAALIPEIWESVAEDYAVYDVNVTTDRTLYETAAPNLRVMVIFTPSKAWYGSAGGVAYLNSFGSATNPYIWVFNVTLTGAAESGSHEIGHSAGLRHDGTSSRAYYSGHTHASGVSWAPIMGTGYNRTIVQFSRGEYSNANRTEDDFEVMSGHFPFRSDDHGDSPANASAVAPDGVIDGSGVIENAGDEDWFRLESGTAGPLSVTAAPHPRFRNLDIRLELLDANQTVVAAMAPDGAFDAAITLPSLPAGVHYLRVSGTGLGNPVSGYSSYGSVGTYILTGTYTAADPADTPTGLTATEGTSTAGVLLAWDPVVPAEAYRLYRGLSSDADEAVLLVTLPGTTYLDESAVAGTIYHYFITATHLSRESPRSSGVSGWRQYLAPGDPAPVNATDDSPHSIRVSWIAADRALSYRIRRNTTNQIVGATDLGTTALLSWHDTTTAPGDPYFYFVEAINPGGVSAPAGTITAGVKIAMPPGTPTGLSASDDTSSLLTLITWNAADGATGYRVYRHTVESIAGATEIATVAATTSYEDTTAAAGVRFWYFVRAILPGGDSLPSNLDAGSREAAPPSIPDAPSATRGSLSAGVSITWTAVPDSDRYFVYRGFDGGSGSAELLGETVSPEWLDEDAEPGRTYRYFVRAANEAGTSDFSAAALGYGPGADPLDDAFENNDDITFATSLTLREIPATAVDADPDWYEVALDPGDTRLDLIVPYDSGKGSILLSLYSANGSPIASSSDAGSARVLSYSGAPGLSYRVLVERDDGAAVPYSLIWRSLSGEESGLEPDAQIGFDSPPSLGGGLRNGNGAGQTVAFALRPGSSRTFHVNLTNRSAVGGFFLLSGNGRQRPFQVEGERLIGGRWLRVTTAMRGSGVATYLEPLASASFRIIVKRDPRDPGRRRGVYRFLSARPYYEPAVVDVVGLRVSARGSAR